MNVKLFIVSFLLLEILSYIGANLYMDRAEEFYLQRVNENFTRETRIVQKSLSSRSEVIFNEIINRPEVIEIFKDATDPKKADIARERLYEHLKASYERLQKTNIKQLHFHLPNNDSFLRFHRPNKYGDNLTKDRKTVAYVNRFKKPVEGFEEGKIYNAFRYVYPLFDSQGKHLGSVEVSTPSFQIDDFMHSQLLDSYIILSKDIVIEKLFIDELKNYTQCSLSDDFLVPLTSKERDDLQLFTTKYYFEKKKEVEEAMRKGDSLAFSLKMPHATFVVSLIALKNGLDNRNIGYIVFIANDSFLFANRYHRGFLFILLSSIVALLLYSFYKHTKYLHEVQKDLTRVEEEKKELNTILDSVSNMIFATNLREIIFANKAFLDFFFVYSIQEFKDKYGCVCDLMIAREGSFLKDSTSSFHWVEQISQLPQEQRVVSFLDASLEAQNFSVSVMLYDEIYYVTFTNITIIVQEKERLLHSANHDDLTRIYNRNVFNRYLKSEYESLFSVPHTSTLVMFDIDHFKEINDNYGHGVGDMVLIKLCELVTSKIRSSDIFARWGGEEFMILFANASTELALIKAHELKSAIEEYEHEGIPKFTVSFGIVALDIDQTLQENLERVDSALYRAKAEERNKVVVL